MSDIEGVDNLNPKQVELDIREIPFANDSLSAQTFYVDAIRGAMAGAHTARLNLVEYRVDAITNEVKAVPVCNLVLPIDQVSEWAKFLEGFASRSQGGSENEQP